MKLVYVLLLSLPPLFGQQINGEVIYNFTPNDVSKEEKADKKELYSLLDQLNMASKGISFILNFNNYESHFAVDKFMSSDLNPLSLKFVEGIVSTGDYYYNLKQNILLRESQVYDDNTLIKSVPDKKIWKLFNESKIIGKYTCYKATHIKTITNNSGEHNFEIIAWYTNEIPVPFGPKEFNGLPGLILELKDRSYTFYATKISLQSSSIEINKLESKRIISEKEHLKRMLDFSYKH